MNRSFSPLIIISVMALSGCTGKNDTSEAFGNFEATETTISSEVAGRLLSFNLEEGQLLDSGKVIGQVDTTDLILKKNALIAQQKAVSAKITNVDAQVAVILQQKENTLVEKNRLTRLLHDKAATQKQMDDVDAAIRLTDKQISSVQTQKSGISDEYDALTQQILQVEVSLKRCSLVNRTKGTVLAKYAEANEMVSVGKALYKIADLDYLFLRVYVSETQLGKLKLGQDAEVLVDKDAKENKKLTGTVTWISPTAEFTPKIIQTKEERVNLVYAVKIRVKNDGSLKIAMPGEANFK